MTWVVTRLCQDNVDTACAGECPVDCFYTPTTPGADLPNMLYISPNECIDCGACEPACPWEAIFQDDSVPAVFQADIELNKRCDDQRDLFTAAEEKENHKPSPEEVAANKKKWGFA
jgi:ferredoxin